MGTRNTHISEKKKTFIPQTLLEKTVTVTQESVDHVTRDCGTADQLARALMSLLFTRRQMAYGNCTDTCGRWHRLNTDILSAIKCKYTYIRQLVLCLLVLPLLSSFSTHQLKVFLG